MNTAVQELILATNNKHKVSEIRQVLTGIPLKLLSLADLPGAFEVVEDGETLEDNAIKKAREIALHYKKWALADDTGLEVDALGGQPGVYSARYAGPECSYDDNNRKLIAALSDTPEEKRTAQFRCVIALSSPEGKVQSVEGVVHGTITHEPSGTNGFGYDPIFFVPSHGKTFALLTADEKNTISHRGQALRKARQVIEREGLV